MSTGKRLPVVSVLMTMYNREKYIADAVESVLASTYQGFELIIVDDGSTDSSVEIAESYARRDNRVRVYINDTNLGDYPNRNKAASLARGKYIKYVDSDDMIYPHGLSYLVETMEKFPDAGYGLCSLEQDKHRIYPFQLSPEEAYKRHYFNQPLFHKAPLSSIIKKDVFESVGGFTGKQHIGDFEMWHILSASFPIVLMPIGVVWSREHADQQMHDNRTDVTVPFKYLVSSVKFLTSFNNPMCEVDRNAALIIIHRRMSRYILRALKDNGPEKAAELLRMSSLSIGEVLCKAFNK